MLIIPPLGFRANPAVNPGPMTGAHLGFDTPEGRRQCAGRLRRLGYRVVEYADRYSMYALMVGGKGAAG